MSSLELCCPRFLNWSYRGLERPQSEAVLLYAVFSSFAVITVALNLLVIISISHFRQLQTPTNLLLLSLAISDFLIGLLVMPVETMRLVEACWLLGDNMCILSIFLSFTLTSTSIGIIVLIRIDRIVAIHYPLQYPNKITRRRTEVSVLGLLISLQRDDFKRQFKVFMGQTLIVTLKIFVQDSSLANIT